MFELLLIILVILIAARLAGELMERIGQMALVGELLVGVLLGIFIIYLPLPQFAGIADEEVFKAITGLGIFFLMFMSGMEIDMKGLAKASKRGIVVGLGGVIFPLILGYMLGQTFLPESEYKIIC